MGLRWPVRASLTVGCPNQFDQFHITDLCDFGPASRAGRYGPSHVLGADMDRSKWPRSSGSYRSGGQPYYRKRRHEPCRDPLRPVPFERAQVVADRVPGIVLPPVVTEDEADREEFRLVLWIIGGAVVVGTCFAVFLR
jgi:hypothetical protein